jgi:hypothetical protein
MGFGGHGSLGKVQVASLQHFGLDINIFFLGHISY